jgi:hypothetical protein
VKLSSKEASGNYKEIFTDKKFKIRKTTELALEPWEFIILEKE